MPHMPVAVEPSPCWPDGSNAPPDALKELAELLERYLRSLPSALAALAAMTREPRIGRSVGFAAGQVLLYLLDDDDLFPEGEFGGLGLIDDTYRAHASVRAIRSAFPQLHLPAGYEPPDERSSAAVRALLPAGVTDALDRTCESLVRVSAALFAVNAEPASGMRQRQALRVEDAIPTLRP